MHGDFHCVWWICSVRPPSWWWEVPQTQPQCSQRHFSPLWTVFFASCVSRGPGIVTKCMRLMTYRRSGLFWITVPAYGWLMDLLPGQWADGKVCRRAKPFASQWPGGRREEGGGREGGRQILDKTNFSKCLLQPRPRLLISYSGMNSPVGGATDEVRVLMSQSSLSTAVLVSEPFITCEPLRTWDPNDDTPFSFSTVGLH